MVRGLRAAYPTQLSMLRELFPSWSDEDLLFVTHECSGEVELAVGRISEGHAEQFSSVKSKKDLKKEAADKAAAAPATPSAAPVVVAPLHLPPAPAAAASAASPAARQPRPATRGLLRPPMPCSTWHKKTSPPSRPSQSPRAAPP